MDSVPLHSSSRLWDLDFQMKSKMYFYLKRGLWTTEFFFSTAQVRRFWRCLWFRSGLVALFLKTSERGDSCCTDSSFSPLLVKLSQVFESALLDCILKLARALQSPKKAHFWRPFPVTVRSHRRRRERQSGRKSFIFNESRRRAPARAARRVLDGESVEESWNQVNFMVMSYDAVRRQPIGM